MARHIKPMKGQNQSHEVERTKNEAALAVGRRLTEARSMPIKV